MSQVSPTPASAASDEVVTLADFVAKVRVHLCVLLHGCICNASILCPRDSLSVTCTCNVHLMCVFRTNLRMFTLSIDSAAQKAKNFGVLWVQQDRLLQQYAAGICGCQAHVDWGRGERKSLHFLIRVVCQSPLPSYFAH